MLLADQRQLKSLVSVMSSVPGMVDGLHDNSRGRQTTVTFVSRSLWSPEPAPVTPALSEEEDTSADWILLGHGDGLI